jgi:hypothetical protein
MRGTDVSFFDFVDAQTGMSRTQLDAFSYVDLLPGAMADLQWTILAATPISTLCPDGWGISTSHEDLPHPAGQARMSSI